MIKFYTWMDEELPCNDLNDIEKYLMLHQDSGYFTIENSFDANILNWMLSYIDPGAILILQKVILTSPGSITLIKRIASKRKRTIGLSAGVFLIMIKEV